MNAAEMNAAAEKSARKDAALNRVLGESARPIPDLLTMLGISEEADIGRAYKACLKLIHPDKNLGDSGRAHLAYNALCLAYERRAKPIPAGYRQSASEPMQPMANPSSKVHRIALPGL